MKKLFSGAILLTIAIFCIAQVPQTFNYQAILRDSDGNPKVNETLTLQIRIVDDVGKSAYLETHNTETNEFGIVNVVIGEGTRSKDLSAVDWSNGPYFINIKVNGVTMGSSPMVSVPYALYAITAGNSIVSGNEAAFEAWDKIRNDDVVLSGDQIIDGHKNFLNSLQAKGIELPYSFGPDTSNIGDAGAYIGFGHSGHSEDFIGYKNNRFYFKDSPGGGDETDPDLIVGGKIGIGVENPLEKFEVNGNVDMHNNPIKNVANPVNTQDAATKAYVDALLKRIEELENQPGIIPVNGLVSYFNFDGNLNDQYGNTPVGTAYGGTSYTTGKAGSAIYLNGTDAYIQFARSKYNSDNNISVALWFKKPNTSEMLKFFVMCGDFAIATREGRSSFVISVPDTNNASGTIVQNDWVHLVGTYDGTNIKVYINSVLKEVTYHPGNISNLNRYLTLGYSNNYWGGFIDDLFIYNKVLAQEEVNQLYIYH